MRNIIAVLLLLVCIAQSQDPCERYSGCYECLYNDDLTCGWCGVAGKCLTGGADGPANLTECRDNYNPNNTWTGWEWQTSRILFVQNKTVGSYLTPDYIEVFLRPGIPLTVPLTLNVPFIPPIDFYFLQDASFSMLPYVENIRNLMPEIANALLNLVSGSPNIAGRDPVTFGMGSYLEKPISPFAVWPESYVYQTLSSLNKNETLLISVLNEFLLTGFARNNEHPEDSYEGIMFAALNGIQGEQLQVGWREGVFRIVFVVTDATAHVEGDGPKLLGIFTPNNGDNVPDGFPPGCGEDYPSAEILKKVLVQTDVNPIIAAVGPVFPWYQEVISGLGVGAAIQLSPDPNDLVQAIIDGTREALSKAILSVVEDEYNRLIRIEPNDGKNLRDGFRQPVTNTTYPFNVTLLAPVNRPEAFGNESIVIVKYVGFGNTITIKINTAINCTGCSEEDPEAQADICGECGGNGTLCIGCDGVLALVNKVEFDICGVCGGDGLSCIGCDGKPNGPVFDLCGICGGSTNSCLGCDGVPNSGKVINCNVCGAPPNCETLTQVLYGLAAIAIIGIVVAIAAIVFFLGASVFMARADKLLMEKDSNLQQNPLYSEAKKKFDNPTFGK